MSPTILGKNINLERLKCCRQNGILPPPPPPAYPLRYGPGNELQKNRR